MTSESPHDDVVGIQIDGRYRIDRFLGAGTMGAVYEARQLAVGRRVAVKVLNSALKTHAEVRERFRLEAQAIAALNHPNCITLYDFGYSERLGALYMVVEYLEGDTLEQRIAQGLGTDVALHLARQVADVCAVAHDAGVLHRDLKPENIMVVDGPSGEPVVKVLDFGLARIFDAAAGDARLTRQGQIFGTPAYMSPEQCGGELEVTAAVDVYALGVTLYELLTGRLPFESPNVAELLVMHAKQPPPPLVCDSVGPKVVSLVEQMLHKDPVMRPAAREVADRLADVTAGPVTEDASASTAPHTAFTESAFTVSRGDRRLVLTAIVFCCVGIAGAVALLVNVDQGRGPLSRAAATPGVQKTVYKPAPRIEPHSSGREAAAVQPANDKAVETAVVVSDRAKNLAVTRASSPRPADDLPRKSSPPPNPQETKPSKPKRFRKLEFTY